MRLIDADELIKDLTCDICGLPLHGNRKTNYANIRATILTQPTIDIKTLPTVRELRERLAKFKWTSAKERLPKCKKRVLCRLYYPDIGEIVVENQYYGNGMWMEESEAVTHWMPLPEPPEEG